MANHNCVSIMLFASEFRGAEGAFGDCVHKAEGSAGFPLGGKCGRRREDRKVLKIPRAISVSMYCRVVFFCQVRRLYNVWRVSSRMLS